MSPGCKLQPTGLFGLQERKEGTPSSFYLRGKRYLRVKAATELMPHIWVKNPTAHKVRIIVYAPSETTYKMESGVFELKIPLKHGTGGSPFKRVALAPGEHKDNVEAPSDAEKLHLCVIYHDEKKELYKLVEGPLLVDTAKGGFEVDPFDPDETSPPYKTFKEFRFCHIAHSAGPLEQEAPGPGGGAAEALATREQS